MATGLGEATWRWWRSTLPETDFQIAWVVNKGNVVHTMAQRHIQTHKGMLPLLSAGGRVVLLGDAWYDTTEMTIRVKKKSTWKYVLRISSQAFVQEEQKQPIGNYALVKGQIFQHNFIGFTQTAELYWDVIV